MFSPVLVTSASIKSMCNGRLADKIESHQDLRKRHFLKSGVFFVIFFGFTRKLTVRSVCDMYLLAEF